MTMYDFLLSLNLSYSPWKVRTWHVCFLQWIEHSPLFYQVPNIEILHPTYLAFIFIPPTSLCYPPCDSRGKERMEPVDDFQ